MSLRLRLTAAYIVLLIPALVAFSFAVNWIASRRIYNAVDDSLIARIESVKALLPVQNGLDEAQLRQSLSGIDATSNVGFAFTLLDPTGRVVFASSRPFAATLPGPEVFTKPDGTSITWHSGRQSNRIAYEPLVTRDGSTAGYIVGAVSLKQTEDALDELQGVFAIGGLLIVLLTGVPAYLLAGRALRPVREVSARAAEIERTGDFQVVLPPPQVRGEISELVQTFNAMIARVQRMLRAQRDFLAVSSHELRRPLTVLRTYIDVLGDPELPATEREASLSEMRGEAEAMGRLISDLLLISREGEETMRRSEVDLQDLCARLMARLQAQDEAHSYRFSASLDARVLGDAERLEQMISNLLENSAQNTPRQGCIDLELERRDGTVRVSVTDTGRGIPEEEQPRIFERFYRGRDAKVSRSEGVGLGLVIVKHVAESHGGRVSFRSRYGSGSCFSIDLPALHEG